MKILNRLDTRSAIITGITTGVIMWRVMAYLGHSAVAGINLAILPLVIPVLWLAGVQLGYTIGVVLKPFNQFGKFAAIGFTNAAVDFGVLYILIAATGLAAGVAYSVFKTISFAFGTAHSYLWNKYWTFEANGSKNTSRELLSFITVAVASMVVNVAVASTVVASRPETVSQQSWAGVAAIAGSAIALIFSFLGFRLFVFKKK